jgi:hypothetical protein
MSSPVTTPGQQLSDRTISLLRTAVPIAWGLLASWLIGLGLPATVLGQVHDLVVAALTAAASAGWYALWRSVEPRLPTWLIRLVLGYATAPSYAPGVTAMPAGSSTSSPMAG